MGFQVYPTPAGSGGLDFAKYPKLFRIKSQPTLDTLTEVLNITGEGYLMCALVGCYFSSTAQREVEIEIVADGTLLVDTAWQYSGGSGGGGAGFICTGYPSTKLQYQSNYRNIQTEGLEISQGDAEPWISMVNSAFGSNLIPTPASPYPFTVPAGVLKHSAPITFKNSLIIRARATITPGIIITGGMK